MKYSSRSLASTLRLEATSLAVTPTAMECRQKPSMLRAWKSLALPRVPSTAVLRARFLTVLMPSMMIARTREVIWLGRE
jgi:hypothetical protein